jgi:hypothetical protein
MARNAQRGTDRFSHRLALARLVLGHRLLPRESQ